MRILSAIFLLFSIVISLPANAKPPIMEKVDLAPMVEYLEDPSGTLTLSDIIGRARSRFKPLLTRGNVNIGYSQSTFWFRIPLANGKDQHNSRLLELSFADLDHVVLYAPGQQPVVTGRNHPINPKLWPHRFYVFPLSLFKDMHYYYLQIRSSSSIIVPLTLWEPGAFAYETQQTYLTQSLYYGGLLALLSYNLLIFASLRERGFLLYSLFATFMGLGMLAGNGLARQFLWPETWAWPDHLTGTLSNLTVIFSLYFTQYILQTRKTLPRIHLAIHFMVCFSWMITVAPWFGILEHMAAAGLSFNTIMTGMLVITAGILSRRSGNSSAGLFLLAWGLLAMGAVIAGMHSFGLLPTNILTAYAVQLGSAAEMVLLSFLLAERIRQERDAREAAQVEALSSRQALVETLRDSEAKLEKIVTERTANLRDSLTEMNEAKERERRLVAYIGHDLRAPLATIVNSVRLLSRQGNDMVQLYQTTIERSAMHQLALIDDLIEYARGELNRLELTLAPTYLHDWVVDISAQAELLATQYNNRLVLEISDQIPPVVMIDPKRLRQALLNLLQNAAKFTSDGEIHLKLFAAHSKTGMVKLDFSVIDTGAGIAPEAIKWIFEPFARGETARAGTGLGLSIAYKLVHAMGGEITVESILGHGSCFSFCIEVNSVNEPDVLYPAPAFVFSETLHTGKCLLVADDNPSSRKYLDEVLSAGNFDIVIAVSGEEAWSLLKQRKFDAVIIDQFMAGMNGWDILREMNLISINLPPFVLYSAMPPQRPSDFPSEIDFAACLLKPSSPEKLLETLRRLLVEMPHTPHRLKIPEEFIPQLRELINDGCITEIEEWALSFGQAHPQYKECAGQIAQEARQVNLQKLRTFLIQDVTVDVTYSPSAVPM